MHIGTEGSPGPHRSLAANARRKDEYRRIDGSGADLYLVDAWVLTERPAEITRPLGRRY